MLVKVGDVIHSFVPNIDPPKNKFSVCINPLARLFLLINTEDRSDYECIKISAETYKFLQGQSRYIGYARYFHIPESERKEILKGQMLPDDLKKISQKISESKRLSPLDKEKLLKYL